MVAWVAANTLYPKTPFSPLRRNPRLGNGMEKAFQFPLAGISFSHISFFILLYFLLYHVTIEKVERLEDRRVWFGGEVESE